MVSEMSKDSITQKEKQGFVKTVQEKPALTSEQRAVLIRKGNALFNSGNFEVARKIFVTTKYTDGLIRMGDHYMALRDPLEAFKMYHIAPAPDKSEELKGRMVAVLKKWLSMDEDTDEEGTTKNE